MKNYITILFMLFSLSLGAKDREFSSNIKVVSHSVSIDETTVNIKMSITTDNLRLKANESLILTPQIIDRNSAISLPEIILNGRNREIVNFRNNQFVESKEATVIRSRRKWNEIIEYDVTVPYHEFYNGAAIDISTMIEKCSRYGCVQRDIRVTNSALPLYRFTPYLSYEDRTGEVSRCDSVESILYFDEAVKIIDPLYKQNGSEIAKIATLLSKDKVSRVSISGSASPLGDYLSNITLSKDRAYVLRDYITANCNVAIDPKQIWWCGENWDLLKEQIERSNMYDKIAALNILDGFSSVQERKSMLSRLSGGTTMRYIQQNIYPLLRYAKCTLYFEEEVSNIENIIKEYNLNPNSLSLDDLLILSTYYKNDMQKYNEITSFAASRYKRSVVVAVNLSSIMLTKGEVLKVYNLLYPLRKNRLVWNNLAVTYAKMGNLAKAVEYLKRAAKQGDPNAAQNIKQLTPNINN